MTAMPSATGSAQEACGLGILATSTRHIRQLPAMFSRGWKQNTGISRPAASHACSTVDPGGTSTSCPSIVSFGMRLPALFQQDECGQGDEPTDLGKDDAAGQFGLKLRKLGLEL